MRNSSFLIHNSLFLIPNSSLLLTADRVVVALPEHIRAVLQPRKALILQHNIAQHPSFSMQTHRFSDRSLTCM